MPVPSIEMQKLASAFFAEAQRDLDDAKVLQGAKRIAAEMTSCQHAAEKALKTIYILAQNRRPPMTHIMLSEIDTIFPNFQKNILRQRLTRWVLYLEQIVLAEDGARIQSIRTTTRLLVQFDSRVTFLPAAKRNLAFQPQNGCWQRCVGFVMIGLR